MRATLDPGPFRDAVAWAARYATSKPSASAPVLAGLLVRAHGDQLTVVGADGDTWATAAVPAVVLDGGAVVLPAQLLAQVAAKLPDAPVELVLDGTEVTVTCGTLAVTTPTQDAADYPAVPRLPEPLGEVDAKAFAAAVAQTAVATAVQEKFPPAAGVWVEAVEDGLRFSASDRYRMARTTVPWTPAAGRGADGAALVPGPALADLARAATGAVGLHLGTGAPTALGLSWPGRRVTTSLLAVEPIQYDRALKLHEPEAYFDVDREALLAALERVAVVYEGGNTVPRLHLDLAPGEVTVRVSTSPRGRASEAVPVAYDGATREMQCNAAYLATAVKTSVGEVLRVGLTPDRRNSVVLTSEADPAWRHMVVLLVDPARAVAA